MKEGKWLLIDEISLADDSVLERLNSVLEKDRKLTLVENSDSNALSTNNEIQSLEIIGCPEFQVIATMNPGGDFGKKELSPALRNRFTEIWCPSNSWTTSQSGLDDWVKIAAKNLISIGDNSYAPQYIAQILVNFLRYVHEISHEIKFVFY